MAKYNFNLRVSCGASADTPVPVRLLIRWGGRTLTYSTRETIPPRYWNSNPGQRNFQRAKETRAFPEYPEFNERLGALMQTAKATFRAYVTDNGREPTTTEYREALNDALGRKEEAAGKPLDLFAFVRGFINSAGGQFNTERKRPFHKATVSRFRVALQHLEAYTAHRRRKHTPGTWDFTEVDMDFVAGFAVYLTKVKGYAANTVVKYGKTLREFLKRAKEEGHPVNEQVFARRLTLKEEPSEQVYLTPEELAAVYRMNLSHHPRLERVRDLFIVGAWTGLRFGDLSRLKPEHVEGNRIRIPTAKTGKEVWIPLHPFVREIMAKYGGSVPEALSNQKANEYLKELLAAVPELQANVMAGRTVAGFRREVARPKWQFVTTHTARRSFASNCYRSGIPARTIMGVTGHTTEQAFQRYIRLTNEEHADIMAASPLFSTPHLKAV